MSTFEVGENTGRMDIVLTGMSIVLWLVVIWYAFMQSVPREQFSIAFIGIILTLFVVKELGETIRDDDRLHTSLLVISGVIVLVTSIYMTIEFRALYGGRVGTAFWYEYWMAAIFILAMLYLVWRSFGVTFLAIVLGGIGYGYLGPYMPGVLWHGGLSSNRMLLILVMDIEGFFGFLTRIVAAWIALFLLFAGLLKGYGAFDLIFRMAVRTSRYIESGVAQTAVVASAIIGSVNGSQTANAGMTGSFTIPLMQRNGMKGETAGGIESVASTLGQVLPPVMGAAAFIMASLLGIPYIDVLMAGVVPAAILLMSTAVAVHFAAIQELDPNREQDTVDDPMSKQELGIELARFGIPIVVLMYSLGVLQYTVITSALYTVLTMIATGIGFPLVGAALNGGTADVPDTLKQSLFETVDGFREGAIVTAPVAIILAAINGVVDIFTTTGVPGAISLALIDLSGGSLIIALVMSLIICIVLGLGMPTTASYTIVALLIAPTLVNQFMVPELAAHFFVFYAALLAGLTPPIATCPAVTAGIAGADFWKTCFAAIKISAPIFVIPFAFVYHPELVSAEFGLVTLLVAAVTFLGAVIMVYGINVPLHYRNIPEYGVRSVYIIVGAFVMVYPTRFYQLAAIGAIIGLYVLQARVLDGMFTKAEFVEQSPTGEQSP